MPSNPIPEIALKQAIVHHPLIVSSDVSITEAIAWMNAAQGICALEADTAEDEVFFQANCRAGCLLIEDKAQLVGILTNHDIVRLNANGQLLSSRSLAEVMTRPVVTLPQSAFTDIFATLRLLQQHHIHHLPLVSDRGQVIGLLTQDTILQALHPIGSYQLVAALEQKVAQLEAEKAALLNKHILKEKAQPAISERPQVAADHQSNPTELLSSNSLQQAILNSTDYSIISTDLTGVIQTFNAAAEQMLGYSAEEVVGKVTPEIIHDRLELQQRAALLSQTLEQSIEPGFEVFAAQACLPVSHEEEWTYIRKDGSRFPVVLSMTALRDRNNQITGFVGIAKDISQRKQAEQRLHSILQELSDFKYALNEAAILAITDDRGRITYVNDRFCEISQYSTEELIGNTHQIINSGYHPKEFFADLWKTIISGQIWRGEIQNRAKDGTYYWVDSTIIPFLDKQGKPWQYVSIRHNITPRKQAEEQLQRNEAHLMAAQRIAQLGSWEFDLKTQQFVWSAEVFHIFGYDPTESVPPLKEILERIHSVDRHWYEQVFKTMLNSEESYGGEFRLYRQDGALRYVQVRGEVVGNLSNKSARLVGTLLDISDRKETEAILTNYAREVEDLYNNAPCGYHSLDGEGCFTSINDTELQWFGYSRAEMIGKPVTDFMTEASRQQFQTRYLEFQQCGYAKDLEYEMVCKDGKVFPILLNATAVRSADGTYLYSRSTSLDIRDRKANEEIAKRQLMAIEAVVDGLAILEGDNFAYLNKSHLELFGYSNLDELVNKSWRLLYSPKELSRFDQEVLPALVEKRHWQGEAIATRKDGSTFHEGLSLTLTDSGALICVCRDVTERKQVEVKTRQANDQLLLANAELARATRLKDEFLANMSHELRTPLNAILGMAEGLQEEVFGEISDRQKKAITTIERSGKHLLELINDILDLSKIESGKLELEITPVAVTYLCESSLTFVRQQALKKNIQLTAQIPPGLPTINVDERRLRQVLINLLNNAVKFTPEGGQVKLVAHLEQQPTHIDLCFSVMDTGVGVASEDKEKLFQPFVQIDSSLNRQHSGTGLGLALVQQLVELHQGTVTVTSDVGKGSCFTVRLPHALSTEIAMLSLQSNRDSLTTHERQVLVIGDSMVAAEQIAQYLEGYGMRSVIHPYSEAAIEEASKICPGLIILNIQLPHLSGWKVLSQLKSQLHTQQIPVLVISVESERSQGLALGAAEYLVEPFSRSQLHQVIDRLRQPEKTSQDVLNISPASSISPLILLAENNEANIATISNYLGSRGYRLVMAKNSQECMAQALAHHPDMILMDVQIPSMDGFKTIQKIRSCQILKNTPILVLTALAIPSDREKCMAVGANEYLTKPVKLKQLLGAIQQLLEKH